MLKLTLLAVAVLGVALSGDLEDEVLTSALNNPKELGTLYNQFLQSHGRHYSTLEASARIPVFKQHLKEIHDHNAQHTSWREAVNDFTDLTDAERVSHLGLNVSNVVRNLERVEKRAAAAPSSVSWIKEGAVTPIKNQGGCGSCWAFGGLGSLEGVYKQKSGVLRAFSEQQILDCTYDRNGCNGGWMRDAVESVNKKTSDKLAAMSTYSYVASDTSCKYAQYEDALIGAKVSGYVDVRSGERNTIAALALRPLSVTLCVINSFYSYSSGIYRDETKTSFPNHALTAVAYTPQYVLVKNSWGKSWGDEGYVKIARNYEYCSFHTYVGYAVMEPSGKKDNTTPDAPTDYIAGDEVVPVDCEDTFDGCSKHICYLSLLRKQCKKSCGDCEKEDNVTVTWCPHTDSYLSGYSASPYRYATLSSAQDQCLLRKDCGGITLGEAVNGYTLRKGSDLKKSPSGEKSWLPGDKECDGGNSTDTDDHWEPVKLAQRYNVSTDNYPIRIKTVGAAGNDQVWLKYYWGRYWGMVRWRFSDYGMELYSCTPGSYSGSKFFNVPDDDEKVWELSWDDKEYTIKCNNVTVWNFILQEGKYSECAKFYGGGIGKLTQFEFKGEDKYQGVDTASDYYYNEAYDSGCPSGTIRCPDGVCRHEHMC